jgi:hypothetical protein
MPQSGIQPPGSAEGTLNKLHNVLAYQESKELAFYEVGFHAWCFQTFLKSTDIIWYFKCSKIRGWVWHFERTGH